MIDNGRCGISSAQACFAGRIYSGSKRSKGNITRRVLKDKRTRRYVERTLHIAIEACLDIGSHCIADRRWREAVNYRDVFSVLNENGIFTQEESNTLKKMV